MKRLIKRIILMIMGIIFLITGFDAFYIMIQEKNYECEVKELTSSYGKYGSRHDYVYVKNKNNELIQIGVINVNNYEKGKTYNFKIKVLEYEYNKIQNIVCIILGVFWISVIITAIILCVIYFL